MVIPKPVRDAIGIRPGDDVYFRVEGGRVVLEKESAKEWLRRYVSAVPTKYKRRLSKPLDLDRLYEEQIEERLGLGG